MKRIGKGYGCVGIAQWTLGAMRRGRACATMWNRTWRKRWKRNKSSLLILRIEVKDISLTDYINVNHAVYVPHTAGRYAKKQFAKGRMPIVERLVNA